MARVCNQCGKVLAQNNPGKLCFACQEKRREQIATTNEELIDAEGYADLLGLASAESIRRLARKGKLAPRVPEVRKWQWYPEDIDAWRKQKQKEEMQARSQAREQAERTGSRNFRMVSRGLASNLRTCRNDPIICISVSDNIGGKAYGEEYILGTGYRGEVESIELVKVDRSVALNMLKQLPREDFPELIGINDWADLPYDRITEDLVIRLETYF